MNEFKLPKTIMWGSHRWVKNIDRSHVWIYSSPKKGWATLYSNSLHYTQLAFVSSHAVDKLPYLLKYLSIINRMLIIEWHSRSAKHTKLINEIYQNLGIEKNNFLSRTRWFSKGKLLTIRLSKVSENTVCTYTYTKRRGKNIPT